ncbi:MAG: nicotinamide-nucleotide amidohydrolase family protein [Spirochaetia bacterium]|nr:nicotinamide-nucleotide amidohydrolase family protein [Spirochaetia bacterium]
MNEHKKIASLLIIGTEITRGIITDKHAQIITKELVNIGFHVNRIEIVPDDELLEKEFNVVIQETDVVILTGGLGPTSDDMTRNIVAQAAHVPLVRHEEAYTHLYERIGDRINGANIRQVYFPKGFSIIENDNGTAPGFYGDIKNEKDSDHPYVKVFALPGPPREMHPMFYRSVLPLLEKIAHKEAVERDEYSVFLTPESKLEDIVASFAPKGIIWGTRAQEHRISLYISGNTREERETLATKVQQAIGPELMVRGEVEVLTRFTQYLKDKNFTISCAESCTGGLLGKLLTDEDGSSSFFHSSIVTYADHAKITLLGVDEKLIEKYGAVSLEVVKQMSHNVRMLSESDVSISISGIAGPGGGSEEKPVGTVCIGFSSKERETIAVKLNFSSYGRASVRRRAAVSALLLGYLYLNEADLLDILSSWQYI